MRVVGGRASATAWRRLRVGMIAVLTTLTTSACSRMGDLTGPTPIGGSVVSVVLSNSAITMGVGTTVALQATGRDRENQPITDRPVVWSSSDSTVVSVSPSGVLTALTTGSAQIAASIAGRSAVAQVTVVARPVASIEIGPLAPRVQVGGFVQLVAIPRDETGAALSGRVVLWSSSDATIANVDATGFLSGLRAGAATITARSETREAAVGVIVTAVPVASVVVSPRVDTIVVGQTTQLTATPRDAQTVPLVDRAISWRSSNNAVASVSASGLVIGVTPGTVNVSAEAENVSGSATVVVLPRPIGAVIVSPAQATLTIGQSTALTVQVTDQNGNLLTGRAIAYASDNAAVAQVTSDGVVRAVGVGTTNIRVTSEGRTGLMSVTVLPTPVASVRIEPATVSLRIGASATLTASALDAGGNVLAQRAVSWSSGAPTVFSVDASGVVRALSVGAGLVFAVIDGRLASASVTVTRVPVSVVQVSPPAVGLVIGGTFNLTATARDASGAVIDRPVVWTSSNPLAVVVSSSGTARALALGSARIDATVDGVVGSTAITVTPVPVANVRVTLTDSSLNVGQTTQATAVLRSASDSILTGRAVVWTSSAPSVATVTPAGIVTGVAGGSANITATSEGISASVSITVSQVAGSLVIQTQPAGAVSGSAFTTQPVIRILDAQGNLVTTGPGATAAVTASKASGDATLSGTLTVNAVGGIATFTNLAFTGTGTGAHTVRFSTASPDLSVTSATVNVVAGAAANIVAVSTQSQSAPVLSLVSAPPSVRVTDAGGNPVSGRAVVFTVTAGLGTTVPASGSSINTNSSGVASLTQWRLGAAPGLNRVLATATGLTGSPVTFNATATIGAPTQLGLTTQPAGAVSGRVLTTQPVVEVRDVAGNRVAGATSAVTATISSGNGTLVGTTTVNAVNGVATFTNLRIDGPGAHQLRFSASGLTAATSNTFTVTQVANALLMQTQPAGARSGQPFTTQPVVRILDDAGILVTTGAAATASVTATVASGTGQLGGTTAVNAVGGIATFTNLSLSGIGAHTLRFSTTAPALNVVSASFTVQAGPPDSIAAASALTQNAPVLTAVNAPPSVRVLDANGNVVSGVDVTFAVTGGGGVTVPASGSTVTTNNNGVATLTSWTLGATIGVNTVTATVAGLKGSPVTFTATGTVGAPSRVAIVTQPAGAVSGVALTTQPVVQIRDAGGNLVTTATNAVTVSVASGNGTLGGTVTVNAVGGIATFTNLVVNGSGAQTLRFGATGLTAAVSSGFTVTQVPASLVVQTQPAGAASGVPFTTQPVIRILDDAGLLVTTGGGATLAVTATINTGTGTLGGVTTVNAVNGVATFTNLAITGGGAHTLKFTTATPALTVNSTSFIVGAGAPTTIVADSDVSQSATVGTAVSDPPSVRVTDAGGNPVSGVSVTFAVTLGNGSTVPVSGSTVQTNASGIASLTSWTLGATAGANTVTATADGLNGSPVTFNATGTVGGASSLAMLTQPTGAVSGVALTTQPVVEILDASGNRVLTATNAVTATLASGTGTLAGTVTVNAVNGVATFTNLRVNGSGAHTIRFTATGLTNVTSASFTVTQVAASLSIQTQPSGAVSGQVFTTQPVVRILDNAGLVVTSGAGATLAMNVAISNGNGTLSGTTTVNAVAGVVTFTNLSITGGGAHRLRFRTVTPALEVISNNFVVSSAAPTQLTLTTQPDGAVSGLVLTTQPVVELRDANGNLVPTATDPVAVAIATGTGELVGTQTVNASNGIATFSDLRIDGAGAHSLTFSAAGLTSATSGSFNVSQLAVSLSVQTQPDGAVSGDVFTTQPVIRILDNAGRVVVSGPGASLAVTVAVQSGTGTLGGTLTVNAVNGVATFTNLAITGSGVHTVAFATDSPALSVVSASFSVAPATPIATLLAVATQPGGAVSGVDFTTQPVIEVRDSNGDLVTTATNAVTATIATGNGSLVGTETVNAVNGVATFSNLRINGSGAHTITFSATGLTSATSSSFTVAQVAASLVVQTQPAGATSGDAFTTQPVVRILDNAGLVVVSGAGASLPVTAAVESGTGTLGGTLTVNAVNGIATFTNLLITGSGAHTLEFTTDTPALSVVSASFSVTPATPVATQLAITTQPDGAVSGLLLTTQPVVEVRDASGDLVVDATNAVTVTIATGTGDLVGTQTVNAVNGVATFTNLRLDGTGAHTLRFAAAGLTNATSSSFTVTQVAASLVVQTQPAGATSGDAFTTQPVVRILDNAGLLVTSGAGATLSVTSAIASGSGTLSGVTSVNAVAGVATFTNLAITGSGAHTLEFTTNTPALSVVSASFSVTPAAPVATQLAVATQPGGAVSGVDFTTQPVVEVRDATGDLVTTATNAVTVTIATGNGALVGTQTVNAVNGVATFTNLRINGSGAHTITFSATGLTSATSSSFTVSQVAASLVVQTQPAGATSGEAFTTQPVVRILDNAGLVVVSGAAASLPVAAAVQSGTGTLGGTLTVNAVNGVATFTNLQITGSGAHTLAFSTDTPALSIVSASFSVTPAAPVATQLAITTQPAGAVSGVNFTTQPVVEVRDATGDLVNTATNAVTATLATGSGDLVGTQTVNAVNGVATFTNLRIDGADVHSLTFAATGLTSATSDNLTVTQVAAALDITTQPAGAVSGVAFTTQPVVRILDNAGLLIASGAASTLDVNAGRAAGTATLEGTLTVQASGGVATFTDLTFTNTGLGAHRIEFTTATPALTVTSAIVTVVAGAADSIEAASVITQNAQVGTAVAAPPSVRVIDANGNPVAGVKVAFAVTLGGGTIVPVATDTLLTNASGLATLTSWTLGATPGENTVTATAVGLAGSPVTFTATGTAPPDAPQLSVSMRQYPRRALDVTPFVRSDHQRVER